MRARLAGALLSLAVAALLCGCGQQGTTDRPDRPATLVLDFRPNAVHAGVYLALERDFDDAEGVMLTVQEPPSSSDGAKLLLAKRAQLAILDIHDLAIARERGSDLVAVMAIVQRPLAAVLAQPGIKRPRQLERRRVGVTGLPSDDAVLASIVAGDGGDPDKVRKVTIGFQSVSALLSRRVAAATAFWSSEGVALRARRPQMRQFRVEDFGAPRYPELVLCATRELIRDEPALVRATVSALRRGYDEALRDPASAIAALVTHAGVDGDAAKREFDAVAPAFIGEAGRFGVLERAVLERWASWEARFGITREPPDVQRAFEFGL